jgi:two-component system KDP operon response regulator KdpE
MRVIIADQRPSVRAALRMVLEHDGQCERILEAPTAAAVLDALSASPDLILLEWGLPGMRCELLLNRLRAARPSLVIVALSDHLATRKTALSSGADCFIHTAEPPPSFLDLLHSLCPGVAERLPIRAAG